jgi:hypothetical protein
MDITFEQKLRAAVSAGWRVLLIEVAFLLVAWLLYRATVPPAGVGQINVLIGPQVSQATVASVWLVALALFKLALWLQAGILLWAWMWSVMLRKTGGVRTPAPTQGAETTPTPTPGAPVAGASAR